MHSSPKLQPEVLIRSGRINDTVVLTEGPDYLDNTDFEKIFFIQYIFKNVLNVNCGKMK